MTLRLPGGLYTFRDQGSAVWVIANRSFHERGAHSNHLEDRTSGRLNPSSTDDVNACGSSRLHGCGSSCASYQWRSCDRRANQAGRTEWTEYALGNATYPNDLTAGPDGKVWFTATNELGSLTVDGALAEYPAPFNSLGSITTGPDSRLWLRIKDSLGRMDPANPGHATTFHVPGGSGPGAIVSGPDGRIWFTASVGTVMPNTIGAFAR